MIKAQFYIERDIYCESSDLSEERDAEIELSKKVHDYFQENLVDLVAMPQKGDLVNYVSFLDKTKFSNEELEHIGFYDTFMEVSRFTFHNGFVELDLDFQ